MAEKKKTDKDKKNPKDKKLSIEELTQHDRKLLKVKDSAKITTKKYKTLIKENEETKKELDAALEIKKRNHPHIIKRFSIKGRGKSESTAVVVASDWHIEERVNPAEVNGMNEYNLAIAKKRADNFFKIALYLTNLERQNTPINTMVVALLGDFITGNIHEEFLSTCEVPPIEAALIAKDFIQSGIDFLLKESDLKLVIDCHPGNHSRITQKTYCSHEIGNSLETMIYRTLGSQYEGNKRVQFNISESYHSYLNIYDKRIRLHHGHEIRYLGGVGGVTIPVNKKINQWNKCIPADIDVFGHYHNFFDGGNFILNGSLIGFNTYALRKGFSFEKPKQAFFVINKKLSEKIVVRPILVEVD